MQSKMRSPKSNQQSNTNIDFWRTWWDERAKPSISNREIDRGSSKEIPELERRAKIQFLSALDPKHDDVVLDAGCGTGVNFSLIHSHVSKIVGLDFSEEQLKRAKRRISEEKLTNITLLSGSITEMNLSNDLFDKVICTSVLQYLNDGECEAAFKEMIRVSKDGATIIIHAKNRTSVYGLVLRLLKYTARIIGKKTKQPDYYRPRIWYGKMLSSHGGQIVDFDSFGLLHFPPLPDSIANQLLRLEMRSLNIRALKRFGVNLKMRVRVNKASRL
jgi:cyclopropane fatty-acyl-phospholipid synthase-like methyltransferase